MSLKVYYAEELEVNQKLVVEHDGKILYEEWDGGEPEDQSYYRDWSWVKGAIEKAYELGLKDGSGVK